MVRLKFKNKQTKKGQACPLHVLWSKQDREIWMTTSQAISSLVKVNTPSRRHFKIKLGPQWWDIDYTRSHRDFSLLNARKNNGLKIRTQALPFHWFPSELNEILYNPQSELSKGDSQAIKILHIRNWTHHLTSQRYSFIYSTNTHWIPLFWGWALGI